MTKNRRDLGIVLYRVSRASSLGERFYALAVFDKQLQVDFEDGLQQTHVRTLVQPDLVLPDVDDEDLTRRKRKKSTLALEVLILASLSSIRAFHVHDQNVLRHARATRFTLVLAHPYSLCGLSALLL